MQLLYSGHYDGGICGLGKCLVAVTIVIDSNKKCSDTSNNLTRIIHLIQ